VCKCNFVNVETNLWVYKSRVHLDQLNNYQRPKETLYTKDSVTVLLVV
jgi:hypothetical protein